MRITIVTSTGQVGTGPTVEAACRDLFDRLPVSVKVGRGAFIPARDATPADVRKFGALWYMKDRSWRTAALVDEVTEGATAK